MITLLLVLFAIVLVMTVLWLMTGRTGHHAAPRLAQRDAFVSREAAQAAFIAGLPSQASSVGMESALPFLYAMDTAVDVK